jgi:hypothetical protein
MRQLALKKKESRVVWQVLLRGIVAMDRIHRAASTAETEAYRKVREKLIDAWKSGIVLGGVRPKSEIYRIMPRQILQETEIRKLKVLSRKGMARSRRRIQVPKSRASSEAP